MIGAAIVGGIFEGVLGLFAKYWRKIISPIVSACVVTAIGFSLLSVGANSFAGVNGAADFGSAQNRILGTVTLVSCILFNIFPYIIRTIFAENCVAVVFITAIIMNLIMPKNMEISRGE